MQQIDPPPPAQVYIKQMTAYIMALYRRVTPPGRSILVALTPFPVDYSIPDKEEVPSAVCRLCSNRSVGPSGMSAEHLRSWMGDAVREESPYPYHWEKVVGLIQAAPREVHLAEECT